MIHHSRNAVRNSLAFSTLFSLIRRFRAVVRSAFIAASRDSCLHYYHEGLSRNNIIQCPYEVEQEDLVDYIWVIWKEIGLGVKTMSGC